MKTEKINGSKVFADKANGPGEKNEDKKGKLGENANDGNEIDS